MEDKPPTVDLRIADLFIIWMMIVASVVASVGLLGALVDRKFQQLNERLDRLEQRYK